MELADSTGAAVADIVTGASTPAPADTATRLLAAPRLDGQWKGSKLVVTHAWPNGVVITDTWELKSHDRELDLRTEVKSPGDMPTREWKRVFMRAEG